MPLVAVVAAPGRRRRRLAAPLDSSFALRSIGVSGVVLWLFFTVYLHNVLDVRRHSGIGVRPPSSRPATPAAAARREVREGSSVAHVREKLLSLEKGAALAAKGGFRPVVEPEPVEQSPPKRQEQHQQAVNNTEGPPPVPSNTEEGISACLLVNDENPRLPEWIAYHYLTLPLRALIVTVDPASRSNPNEIVINWWKEMGLHINVWSEKRFLHPKMRGPCPEPDDPEKCLWHHRDRQQYFIMRCMSEFKKMNKTWVLLTDVDEYVVMNRVAADDPPVPLDEPPEGVPVMPDWRFHNAANVGSIKMGVIDGTINGLKAEPRFVDMTSDPNETFAYGTVVTDVNNHRFFLRDDVAYQESTAMVRAPPGVPTLKEPWFAKEQMYARIYNDTYDNKEDGTFMNVPMDWKMGDAKWRAFHGGSLIVDKQNRTYFVEYEAKDWPRRFRGKDSLEARRRLPSVEDEGGKDGDGGKTTTETVLDVLKRESEEGYTNGAGLGPCLSMPRLLYGSREDNDTINNNSTAHQRSGTAAPDGFDARNFVTLRYKWHASKGEFDASRYGKTMIDVSRIPAEELRGKKALSIHRPLTYHCRKDPPRYAVSLFRVVSTSLGTRYATCHSNIVHSICIPLTRIITWTASRHSPIATTPGLSFGSARRYVFNHSEYLLLLLPYVI